MPSLTGVGLPEVEGPDRRTVLRLLAASFALGGVGGCDGAAPDGQYVPAVVAPPGIVAGVANFYASAVVRDGTALGVVVEHAMGRPIKIEGNQLHPSSLGGSDAVTQAMILDLYDPERATGLQLGARPASRQALLAALVAERARAAAAGGRGLRLLTGPTSSPTLIRAVQAVLAQYPEARWSIWEPSAPAAARRGAALAYGRAVSVLPHLDQADVIVSLGGDVLADRAGSVRYAREFARRRNPTRATMSRVYAVEPTPTLIGAAADHRIAAGPGALLATVNALAGALLGGTEPADAPGFVAPILADLRAATGRAFIDAGPDLPAEAHALVHAINEALGGRDRTFTLIEPPLAGLADDGPGGRTLPFATLREELEAGRVDQLVILDSNPAFTSPGFEALLRRVRFSLASAPALDETGKAATWFVPATQMLEGWGDALGHDGTATVLQPQTLPLYGGWSPIELLSLLRGAEAEAAADAVRATWRERLDDAAWQGALAAGVVPGTARAALTVPLAASARSLRPPALPAASPAILFREDPYLGDGRWANNGWLQELPRPHSKLTWDNPLLLSPALAASLGVDNGDMVALEAGGARAEMPVWVLAGQADDCVVATLGNGRRVVGTVGTGAGFDAYPLQGMVAPLLRKAKGRVRLASTDRRGRERVESGEILRRTTLAAMDTHAAQNPAAEKVLYRRQPNGQTQWGMSIDLNTCIGCNACVVACQAENNVPVVGKEQVLREREMHWLRIDRYDIGTDAVEPAFQPVLCMHCEQAPCEVVCPVEATQHDEEGLNLMVYNRCVGTRFCSNNCPYKVRRFNFASYAHEELRPPIARNPDVSVRSRGVMEKCTFCVQRIAEARIAHDRDGVAEVAQTACAAACPTASISFGDLTDPTSEVVKRKHSPLDYALLPEQSTYPRVTYEMRVRNRNKEQGA